MTLSVRLGVCVTLQEGSLVRNFAVADHMVLYMYVMLCTSVPLGLYVCTCCAYYEIVVYTTVIYSTQTSM